LLNYIDYFRLPPFFRFDYFRCLFTPGFIAADADFLMLIFAITLMPPPAPRCHAAIAAITPLFAAAAILPLPLPCRLRAAATAFRAVAVLMFSPRRFISFIFHADCASLPHFAR
jgi:hypothetical protein